MVKAEIDNVPYFNAPIFLENKEQIGKVDEIFGNVKEYSITVKLSENMKADHFKAQQKVRFSANDWVQKGHIPNIFNCSSSSIPTNCCPWQDSCPRRRVQSAASASPVAAAVAVEDVAVEVVSVAVVAEAVSEDEAVVAEVVVDSVDEVVAAAEEVVVSADEVVAATDSEAEVVVVVVSRFYI